MTCHAVAYLRCITLPCIPEMKQNFVQHRLMQHHSDTTQSLRKLAHAIYKEFLSFENFQQKNLDIFLIFAQNIDCGYTLEPPHRGGSNVYPQSMFWSKN